MRKRKVTRKIGLAGLTAAVILTAASCAASPDIESASTTELTGTDSANITAPSDTVSVSTTASCDTISTDSAEPTDTVPPDTAASSGAGDSSAETADYNTVLMEKAESICGTYFKGGDMSYRLEVSPGGRKNRNQLTLDFMKAEPPGRGYSLLHQLQFFFYLLGTKLQTSQDNLEDWEEPANVSYQFQFYEDGRMELFGDSEAAGVYFPMETLFLPDVYERPLNETDLLELDAEKLRLLRNQYFAVYGREFKNQELQQYFEQQPWYEKAENADQKAEANFTELDKRNMEFIKKAEKEFDRKQWERVHKEYEQLSPAPYKELLPEHMEIGISLNDFENTKDKGLYYEAPGTISLPLMLTPQEYETVMKEFEEVEICVNELTGETAVVSASDGEYGDVALQYQSEDWTDYCYLDYEPYSGCYRLWGDSDDTRFKKVYEGSIYVLKGAEEEWGYHFFSSKEERPPAKIVDFQKPETLFEYEEVYGGNRPVFDEKGYVKALYYFGD